MPKPTTEKPRPPQLPPHLPDAVISIILQHVPVKQRLESCALVCRRWATAAAFVTTAVDAALPDAASCQQLWSWMVPCAGHVTSLNIMFRPPGLRWATPPILQLPGSKLSQLQVLKLQRFKLALHAQQGSIRTSSSTSISKALAAAGGSSAGSSHGAEAAADDSAGPCASDGLVLPQLQHLQLVDCELPLSCLQLLMQSTHLTHLVLQDTYAMTTNSFASAVPAWTMTQVICSALRHLPDLSHLALGSHFLEPQVLGSIGSLQRLQHVGLKLEFVLTASGPASLAQLPKSITSLLLDGAVCPGFSLHSKSAPHLHQFTALQQLELRDMQLVPTPLQRLRSSLQRLCLIRVDPVLPAPQHDLGPHRLPATGSVYRDMCMQGLLVTLGHLTQLKHLELQDMRLSLSAGFEHYSALTASSRLTALKFSIVQCVYFLGDKHTLPKEAWQHMLPSGKLLPDLRLLEVVHAPGHHIPDNECTYLQTADCVDVNAVGRIATCCPALQQLGLINVVREEEAVRALQLLPACLTSLNVGGEYVDSVAVSAVNKLTGLKSLSLDCSDSLTVQDVEQLSALQGLQEVRLTGWKIARGKVQPWWHWGRKYPPHPMPVVHLQQSPEVATPDVWCQLQKLCEGHHQ